MHQHETTMKLYHQSVFLGEVATVGDDFPGWWGRIRLSQEADAYLEVFYFLTDEENFDSQKDPPFPESRIYELIDSDEWYLENPDGSRRRISVPAIHRDGMIYWQWRE